MTDRSMEQALRTALEHAAPNDVESVLLRCDDRKGNVIPMTNQTNHANTNRKPLRLAALAAAACLVLAIGGGSIYYNRSQTVASIVSLDVNPSIELVLNRSERVLRATALNEDATAVLDGMDLKGATLDVAVNALMGSLLKNGYVDELANSILITVEDDDQARAAQLESQLTETVNAVMTSSSINGAILSQIVSQDQTLQQQADAYGISLGKAQLIQQLVDQNPTLTFESLAGKSVNDLNLLLSSQATTLAVNSTGSASDGAYIGAEVAKNAALAHAGLTADQVTVSRVDFDMEDGRMVYEVEFWAGDVEYEYDVDAATGEILKNQTERYTASAGQNNSIDQNAAKTAALSSFGLSESQAEGIVAFPSYDDGKFVYKVKFWTGSTEYYCAVDGSGQIVKSEKKEHSSTGSTASSSGTDVGLEAAKTAALNHAGLSASQVSGLTAKLDWDDGQRVYEVEFWQGSTEYEYEINADGTVRQYESEAHATPTVAAAATAATAGNSAASSDIGEAGAKTAALTAAGLTEDKVQNLFIERDWDDGRIQYDVKFLAGSTQYEYEIDGTTGSILKGENKATATGSGTFISADDALAKALAHAGLNQSSIRELDVEPELDDNVPHYSIEFKSGNLEYEYEINAQDGSVIKYEQDR